MEESTEVKQALDAAGLGMVLFAAPTTGDERLADIAAAEPVFIYGVAEMGVTGERETQSDRPAELARRVRSITDIPLVLGVGISTAAQAGALRQVADGVIVGSALVRRVLEAPSGAAAVRAVGSAVQEIVAELS